MAESPGRWWLRPSGEMAGAFSETAQVFPLIPAGLEHGSGRLRSSPHARAWLGKSWLVLKAGKAFCRACRYFCKECAAPGKHGAPRRTIVKQNIYAVGLAPGHLKVSNLLRHERSYAHRHAVASFLGMSGDALLDAPSTQDFCKVWHAAREGTMAGPSLKTVGQRKKLIDMRKCLYEGMRQMDEEFFEQNPGAISSLLRDERNHKILVDYVAATPKLAIRRGTLGLSTVGNGGVNGATDSALKQAFTSLTGQVRQSALSNFLSSVHVIASDAAPDEVLAAKQIIQTGAGQPGVTSGIDPLTSDGHRVGDTNLGWLKKLTAAKYIARDKAHGCQRTAFVLAETQGRKGQNRRDYPERARSNTQDRANNTQETGQGGYVGKHVAS